MTEYYDKPTQIRGSTADKVSLRYEKVHLYLSLKNGRKRVVFNQNNVFLLPSNSFNLISLGLLNIHGIFYDNQIETLYNRRIKKTLAYAKK